MADSLSTAVSSGAMGSGDTGVILTEEIRTFYSKEIIYQAMPTMKFLQFARVKTELQTQPGKTISFTKYSNLTGGGSLTEGTHIVAQNLSTSEITLTVAEQGNAVKVSELLLQTAIHDVLLESSKLLGRNVAVTLDTALRDVVLTTSNWVYGGGKTIQTDLVSGDGFTTTVIKDAVETLANQNAPKFENEYYICMASPHQLRQLRDDPDWVAANTYGGFTRLWQGEVGKYENVRFIETTQMPTIASGTGGVTPTSYKATFFGENAYGWGVALPVELRDNGVVDFGREHALAWYAIWGTGLIETANIVAAWTA